MGAQYSFSVQQEVYNDPQVDWSSQQRQVKVEVRGNFTPRGSLQTTAGSQWSELADKGISKGITGVMVKWNLYHLYAPLSDGLQSEMK